MHWRPIRASDEEGASSYLQCVVRGERGYRGSTRCLGFYLCVVRGERGYRGSTRCLGVLSVRRTRRARHIDRDARGRRIRRRVTPLETGH